MTRAWKLGAGAALAGTGALAAIACGTAFVTAGAMDPLTEHTAVAITAASSLGEHSSSARVSDGGNRRTGE